MSEDGAGRSGVELGEARGRDGYFSLVATDGIGRSLAPTFLFLENRTFEYDAGAG